MYTGSGKQFDTPSDGETDDRAKQAFATRQELHQHIAREVSAPSPLDTIAEALLDGESDESYDEEAARPAPETSTLIEDLVEEEERRLRRPLNDLKNKQLEQYGLRYEVVCRIDMGIPTKQVLEQLKLTETESWARKLYKRYIDGGKTPESLMDGRWQNGRETVLRGEVLTTLLGWYFARPAAGPKSLWELTADTCKNKGWPIPGYDAVKDYLARMPLPYKMLRSGKRGEREWRRSGAPRVLYENTTYSNQRWQTDHTVMPIWIKRKEEVKYLDNGKEVRIQKWVVYLAFLTIYLDTHSRSIPGFLLSGKTPDAMTSLHLMAQAVKEKKNAKWRNRGLPDIVQPDRGSDFISLAVKGAFNRAGVHFIDPDYPHNPDRKGKCERFFRTIKSSLAPKLPGHVRAIGSTVEAAQKYCDKYPDSLLTIEQLRQLIEDWIVEKYHQRTHSTTGRKPAELFEETLRLREPVNKQDLDTLLLKGDVIRTVTSLGIKFSTNGFKGRYWSPEMIEYRGRKVEIRYNPEDLQSILLYDISTDKFLLEAWVMGKEGAKYTSDDVVNYRLGYLKGLKKRIQEFREKIQQHDRPSADKTSWEEARLEHNAAMEKALHPEASAGQAREPEEGEGDYRLECDEDLNEILQIFKRQDRGQD